MDPLIKKAYEASKAGQSFAVATVVESTIRGTPRKAGAKMIVLKDGTIFGTIGGGRNEKAAIEACKEVIRANQAKLVTYENFGKVGQSVCGGKYSVFIEPYAGTRQMIICGGGHIALPLSVLAKMLNFEVTVIDNRKEFSSKKRFPHVDKIIFNDHAKAFENVSITPFTYIVIVTHGNEHDLKCLKKVISSQSPFIGVVTSHTKRLRLTKALEEGNFAPKDIERIKMPVGIDIGAQTPEEIAISICAEIISEYNKSWLKSKKFELKKTERIENE